MTMDTVSSQDQADSRSLSAGPSPQEEESGDGRKRRRVTRRTLSCTECKRRKTKCSSLGVTPCTSCVRRGRPDDCRWENLPETPQNFALSSEVDTLRTQVQDLHRILHEHIANHAAEPSYSPSRPSEMPTSSSLSQIATYPRDLESDSTRVFEHTRPGNSQLEHSVSVLEDLAQGSEGQIQPASELYLTKNPVDPSRLSRSQPSRLPRLLERSTRHTYLIDSVFEILPEQQVQRHLLKYYLDGPFHRGWHVIHVPSFLHEYEAFSALERHAQQREVDIAWIAVLMMMLAHGMRHLPNDESHRLFPYYSSEDISNLPYAFYQASMMALEAGKCDVIPQIRHVQASLLCVPFLFHFGSGSEDSNASRRIVSAAITTAEWLGLDQIASDPAKAPLNDPAFSKFSTRIAFEMSKRLFHFIAFLDGTMWKKPGQWRLAQATTGALATDLPCNLNDEDLLDSSILARPPSELTHSTIPRVGSMMGMQTRNFMQVHQHGGEMTYDQVLKYDAALRGVLTQLPSPLLASPTQDSLNWMQFSLFASIHNRLLRAHRPYMMSGYNNDKCQESTLRSIECAKNITAAQRALCQSPALRPWFSKAWILRAVLVLIVDWAVSINRAHPAELIACKRLYATEASELFCPYPQDKTPLMSKQCAGIIEALLAAGDQRAAGSLPESSVQPAKEIEDFFEGVSAALRSSAAPDQSNISSTELLDLSIFSWFQSQNSGTSEQSDDMRFDFGMLDGWNGLGYEALSS